jgi:anti-sigma-K factor RskA
LDVLALPAQPSGSYLQFWALVDGKPVSMGMIKADSTGLQTFPCVPDAAGFAVSIEDKPDGNQTPTVVLMLGT